MLGMHSHVWVDNGNGSTCSGCGVTKTHVHSYQAVQIASWGTTYQCSICQYSYVRNHTMSYSYLNASTHTGTCTSCGYQQTYVHVYQLGSSQTDAELHNHICRDCNDKIFEPHNFQFISQGDNEQHKGVCSTCGYETLASHNLQYEYLSSTQHTYYCPTCSYSGRGAHFVRAGSSLRAICLGCGALVNIGDIPIIKDQIEDELSPQQLTTPGVYTLSNGSSIQIISATGSYMLPNGIIVLSEEDVEAYYKGELNPCDLLCDHNLNGTVK